MRLVPGKVGMVDGMGQVRLIPGPPLVLFTVVPRSSSARIARESALLGKSLSPREHFLLLSSTGLINQQRWDQLPAGHIFVLLLS